jgi:hypothetical protein
MVAAFVVAHPSPSKRVSGTWLAYIRTHYTYHSLLVLAVFLAVGLAGGYRLDDLIDRRGSLDSWLAVMWVSMAVLIPWNVNYKRDIVFSLVALVGGGIIEWWGTTTEIWWYYTSERPPLWIIPAWASAGLAIDRLALWLEGGWERSPLSQRFPWEHPGWVQGTRVLVAGFSLWMLWFMRFTLDKPSSWMVIAIMVGVTVTVSGKDRDVFAFVAGSLMGIVIETWGTSHHCWTYYTKEIPPWVAVAAHGFAGLAFRRGVLVTHLGLNFVRDRLRSA